MKTTFLTLSLCLIQTFLWAQSPCEYRNIREILANPYTNGKGQKTTFNDITQEADHFFSIKCPNLTRKEMASGAFKDDDFVKYERWKHFWKYRLNADGTLGDITTHKKNKQHRSSKTASCSNANYQTNWSEVNYNGNFGYQIDMGRVSSIGFHPTAPNTFWVGAAFGGLWKTTDGGQTYSIVNDDLPHTAVADIIVDSTNPDRLFIALSDIVWYGPAGIGIYESTDGGVTFAPTSLTFTLPQNIRIYEIDVNPNDPSELLVATSDGLYRTDDYFATHTKIYSGDFRAVRYSLHSNDAYAGGASGEFYKSTDNGVTFTFDRDFGNGQVRISVSNKQASGYVALTNDTNLAVSSDFGQTFYQRTIPETNSVVAFANGSDTNIAIGNFECYRSSNGGNSFQATTHWLGEQGLPFVHVDQRNIYTNPLQNDYIYYCNDGGVFRYSVSSNSFENLSRDLYITQYYDIAVSQTAANVLGAGSQDNGNVTRNANGQWQSYEPTADGMGQEIDFTNPAIRYYSIQLGALRRWNNGSLSYISPPNQNGKGAWETPFKLDPTNASRIIIGYKSVYASDNRGNSWTNIGANISANNLEQIAIAQSNSNRIYASQYNTVYAKNPANTSWTSYTTPVYQYISDLEVHPTQENTLYISYGGFTDSGKVYRSTDGGVNWVNISYNLPNTPILSLETYNTIEGSIFVGTYNGVYYLKNGGTAWEKYGCLPNTSVNDIEIQYLNGDKIFVGTHGRGIFEAPLTNLECDNNVIAYVNDGTNWLQQNTLTSCIGDNIYLGMQNIGTQNVQIQYPDGTIDTTPDLSTAWAFNNIQAADAGVYVVSYDNGSCIGQTSITLNIPEPLALIPYVNDGNSWLQQGELAVCSGTNIYIGVQNAGVQNFEITYPDGTTDTTPDLSTAWALNNVQPEDSGIYTVRYDNQADCSNNISTQTINLTVHADNPDLSNAVTADINQNGYNAFANFTTLEIDEGSQLALALPASLFEGTVRWTAPNGTIYETHEISFDNATTTNVEGDWSVTAYFTNDCPSGSTDTQTMNFSIDLNRILSTPETTATALEIYPIPADKTVFIKGMIPIDQSTVYLLDLRGKRIQTKTMFQNSTVAIDVSDIPKGIYMLLITQENSTSIQKLIKD